MVENLSLFERLRDDVVSCRLAPGKPLRFDALRARYDASVGSLRECLHRLSAEGLVFAEQNRGFTVAPISLADLDDVTEMRVHLETRALTSAMERGGDRWRSRLVEAHQMLTDFELRDRSAPLRRRSEWEKLHEGFHDSLVAACGSPRLLSFRRILWKHTERYRAISVRQDAPPGRNPEHSMLVDLIVAGDIERATRAAAQHIREASTKVREWLATRQPGARDELRCEPRRGATKHPASAKCSAF